MTISELIKQAEKLSENIGPSLYGIIVTKNSDELEKFVFDLEGILIENEVSPEKIKSLTTDAKHLYGHPTTNFERFIKELKQL